MENSPTNKNENTNNHINDENMIQDNLKNLTLKRKHKGLLPEEKVKLIKTVKIRQKN